MHLVTFSKDSAPLLGALLGDTVIDLVEARKAWMASDHPRSFAAFPKSMIEFLEIGDPARDSADEAIEYARAHLDELRAAGAVYAAADVTFLPPIQRPGKIICVGRNYLEHAKETGNEPPKYPMFFAKFANVLVGHREPIRLPRVSEQVDFEAELAIVIGRTAKDIPAERAFDVIAGYAPFNDVSVRDYQYRTQQFLQGKTFDTTGPMGPAIVTADEIADPGALDITLRLNGEVMQHANTADLIFKIPLLIEYITAIMTLEPGDIIATGTPAGVGYARDPKVFLKPGDTVQIEIGGLDMLENPVIL